MQSSLKCCSRPAISRLGKITCFSPIDIMKMETPALSNFVSISYKVQKLTKAKRWALRLYLQVLYSHFSTKVSNFLRVCHTLEHFTLVGDTPLPKSINVYWRATKKARNMGSCGSLFKMVYLIVESKSNTTAVFIVSNTIAIQTSLLEVSVDYILILWSAWARV